MSARYFGRRGSPEYHSVVRFGSGLVIGSMFFQACVPERQIPTPTSEIFPTRPIPTEVFIPTPDLSNELVGLVRTPQEIQEAVGRFVGDGGPVYARVESVGEKEDVFETLKASLNRNGLGIFHEGRIVSQIAILGDGTLVCFPVMPKQLWNPYVERHQDNWIRDEQFVISYGNGVSGAVRYQAISAISLEKSVDSLTCVNAFVNRENNIYGAEPTTLFTVLMDQNTGEIFGEVPTVYGADDRVEVQVDSSTGNLKVVVNGMPVWFTGERMVELAEQATSRVRRDFEIKGGIISAEGLLSECKQVLEIEPSLIGMARVEGAMVNLNFPNIRNKITFGLHPSVMDRPAGSEFYSVKRMFLNNEYWDAMAGKGSAERQILTDIMYLHYRAWQYDQNWVFHQERKNISFLDYLRMLDREEIDGGHDLSVRVDKGDLLPYDDPVRIYPSDPMVVVFADYGYRGEPYIGGSAFSKNFAFDPIAQTFILVSEVRKRIVAGHTEHDRSLFREMIVGLAEMSQPSGYQWDISSPPPHDIVRKLQQVIDETYEVIFGTGASYYAEPPLAATVTAD